MSDDVRARALTETVFVMDDDRSRPCQIQSCEMNFSMRDRETREYFSLSHRQLTRLLLHVYGSYNEERFIGASFSFFSERDGVTPTTCLLCPDSRSFILTGKVAPAALFGKCTETCVRIICSYLQVPRERLEVVNQHIVNIVVTRDLCSTVDFRRVFVYLDETVNKAADFEAVAGPVPPQMYACRPLVINGADEQRSDFPTLRVNRELRSHDDPERKPLHQCISVTRFGATTYTGFNNLQLVEATVGWVESLIRRAMTQRDDEALVLRNQQRTVAKLPPANESHLPSLDDVSHELNRFARRAIAPH